MAALEAATAADSGQMTDYCQIVVSSNATLGEAAVPIWNDCNIPFWSCVLLNNELGSRFPAHPLASGLVPR
jgi:hypothetical protein